MCLRPVEQRTIDDFCVLLTLAEQHAVPITATPDCASQGRGGCDALIDRGGVVCAVEHTSLDSFHGQRHDDAAFGQVILPVEEARKDAVARAAILAKLEATLAQGPKAVIGNKSFARFITVARGSVTINRAALEADARLDGKFILRTNTELPAAEVARAYKSLWRVERTFREQKSTLEIHPLYHRRDDTRIGHIVACFLALRLEVNLQRRLDARGVNVA